MDDKTFIASYVADEAVRLKDRVKNLVEAPVPPTEEEKAALIEDMHTTLLRLKAALVQITPDLLKEDSTNAKPS